MPEPDPAGFAFEDVGFRYPGSEAWAVRHLSFTLAAGETLALVGENGAGKTTIVKLMTRLYDPTKAESFSTVCRSRLRARRAPARIGVIFQISSAST